MKIAVLSDVHGNANALEAVLADAKAQRVDEFWTLGDVTVRGPQPEECLNLLESVNTTARLLGNHEENYRKTLTGDSERLCTQKKVMATILTEYDRQHMSAEHFQKLLKLPMTVEKQIGSLKIRLQHVFPDFASGHLLHPTGEQANFDRAAAGDPAIVIYAHTHTPTMRYSTTGQLILNAGSIGLPTEQLPALRSPKAMYLLLTFEDNQLTDIDYRKVDFDIEATLAVARERHLPYYSFYERTLLENSYQYVSEKIGDYNEQHHLVDQAAQILAKYR